MSMTRTLEPNKLILVPFVIMIKFERFRLVRELPMPIVLTMKLSLLQLLTSYDRCILH